jgi:hypothetical protein
LPLQKGEDEEAAGISYNRRMRNPIIMPPTPTAATPPPSTGTTTPVSNRNPTDTGAKNPLAGAGAAGKGSSSAKSAYDKYLAAQKAEAAKAKRKAGNRYIEQAETLGLQAQALRRLLGLGSDGLGLGGKLADRKGKAGKTTTTVKEESGTTAWESTGKNPDDPRNKLLHPWQQGDGRGASGNRNEPKPGGLPGVNLPRSPKETR